MPRLRSDDGPRHLRAVWLGPKGATLPFTWTYVQWLGTLLFAVVLGWVALAITFAITRDFVYTVAGTVLYGWAPGLYLGMKVMAYVDVNEPVRFKRQLLRTQLSRKHRELPPAPVHWQMSAPRITPLGEGALHCLRWWDDASQHPLTPPQGSQPQ